MIQLKSFIRDIPNFPKKGIMYKDITPLLSSKDAFSYAIALLSIPYLGASIDAVIGIESRGFIFGTALANQLGIGFVPIRKFGKLPYNTHTISYKLEYGRDKMEIHSDALDNCKRVVIIDDILATGGTIEAATQLVKRFPVDIIGISFLIELEFLHGRKKISSEKCHRLLSY